VDADAEPVPVADGLIAAVVDRAMTALILERAAGALEPIRFLRQERP